MIKVSVLGLGKMGLSHLSILGAHPEVEIVGVCDTSLLVTDIMGRFSVFPIFKNYKEMLDKSHPNAIVISLPTVLHADVVQECIDRQIDIFVEKPFTVNANKSFELASLANRKQLVNQVGYHNRYIATFKKVKELLTQHALGKLFHFEVQAHGPVITRKDLHSWRSTSSQGGGCLMDYASHAIDLVNYIISPVSDVGSVRMPRIFSSSVEDAVYATLFLENKLVGNLSVNWSDDSFRKMSTSISIIGTNGKIIADANELKLYLRDSSFPGYTKGWNIQNVSNLSDNINFYLRGEEYSLQLDDFVSRVRDRKMDGRNTFISAALTDIVIEKIVNAYLN